MRYSLVSGDISINYCFMIQKLGVLLYWHEGVYVVLNSSTMKIVTAIPVSKEKDAKKMFKKKTGSDTYNSDEELAAYFWRVFMDEGFEL